MKIGDLVKVPDFLGTPSYIGLIIGEAGYNFTIFGGEHLGIVSLDGTPGVDTWHRLDLELISSEKND